MCRGQIASRFRFSMNANSRSLLRIFLLRLVALANFLRLSLLKGAHAAAGECRVAGNPGTLRSGRQIGGRWPTLAWAKGDGHSQPTKVPTPTQHYGLKKWSSSSSSCLLSEARTRMWRTMVPEMRGEKPSGWLWQREQFCSKTRWPSSSCCGAACATAGFLFAGVAGG
jgi:hypothetical protein